MRTLHPAKAEVDKLTVKGPCLKTATIFLEPFPLNARTALMTIKRLLLFGLAMPVIYLIVLAAAASLTPGFSLIRSEPSELGIASVAYPVIYNGGMIATGVAGWLAAVGLFVGLRRTGSGAILSTLASACLILASTGLMMSGLFPLPNPLLYGFGLSATGVLIPLLGACACFRANDAASRRDGITLLLLLAAIITLAVSGGIPLVVGLAMFGAIAFLSMATRSRIETTASGASTFHD